MRYLKGIEVLSVVGNLVDRVWDGQPAYPENEVTPLEVKFCGESWQSKVKSIRSVMAERGVRDKIQSFLKFGNKSNIHAHRDTHRRMSVPNIPVN